MPAPSPLPVSQPRLPFPLLSPRYPDAGTESLIPKHWQVGFSNSQQVKIGRKKGLSRQHAQVWEDGGKISIKDARNSNRTHINGEQLSQEDCRDVESVSMGGSIWPLMFNRLQGELQKSKDTGAELHNVMTKLGEIQDMLGGSFPQNIVPPHSLPPIHPPQAQQLAAAGENQSSLSAVTVAATIHNYPPPAQGTRQPLLTTKTLLEIQLQLQDTQSSLASQVYKIRSLEIILANQESLKQEMQVLRDFMKAHELKLFRPIAEREKDASRRLSSNFEDDEDGEDDDSNSIMTITAGENGLKCIDEDMEHRDIVQEIPEHDLNTDEEKHRRREELGRPKTPEPMIQNSSSSSQGLVSLPSHKGLPNPPDTNSNQISEWVSALSEQVKAVMSSLEEQHVAAQASQATIQALDKRVESFKARVKVTWQEQQVPPPPPTIPIRVIPLFVEIAKEKEEKEAETSLTEILSEWEKSVQGQWSSVQEEWNQERERFDEAREVKAFEVDIGLRKMASIETSVETVKEMQTSQGQQLSVLQALITGMQQQAQEGGGKASWFREHAEGVVAGDSHGLNRGLVTLPSPPRSRFMDSVMYRMRKTAGKKKREGDTRGSCSSRL